MELRHLRYFIAVAEEENVTRAAARLHVSQPSLSRQVRDLEHSVGVALFEHGPKSVRLTEAGRSFLAEARAVMRRAEEAVAVARAVAKGETGELRIGYAPSLAVDLLPKILRRFQTARPGVRVQLSDLSSQEMARGLREGALHAALMSRMGPEAMPDVRFVELQRQAVCVALAPGHPLARKRRLGLADLAGEKLVAFTLAEYPEYHLWLAEMLAPLPVPPRIVEEHDAATSLITSVETGRGIAIVSEHLQCLSGPRLKVRALQPPPPPLVIGLARREGDCPAALETFFSIAQDVATP